jgi:prepilin-type N-terminal cleavage/methylation domain-containing protein
MKRAKKAPGGFSLLRRMRSSAGFTLVEVLVAIGILSFGMLGLAVGAISITKANKTAQFHTMATNMAQDKLEQIKATTIANVAACASSCETAPTYLGVTFTRTWTVTANTPAAGLTQITVTVNWTDYTSHSVAVTSAMQS